MDSWRSATDWLSVCILVAAGSVFSACGHVTSDEGTAGSNTQSESGAGGGSGDRNAGGAPSGASDASGFGNGGGSAGLGGASGMSTGGGGTSGGAAAGANAGGFGGDDCKSIQQRAQQAADTSCTVDSDCERSPHHMPEDCLDCGAVMSAGSEERSIAAVITACQPFFAQGCTIPLHSCPIYQASCNAGVCQY